MTKKYNADDFLDISVGLPEGSEKPPKAPLAKDYFEASPGARKTRFNVEIIFLPSPPYNNYGIVTHAFRGNINPETPFGKAFTEALEEAVKGNLRLAVMYSENSRQKFTVGLLKNSTVMYTKTNWGYKVG